MNTLMNKLKISVKMSKGVIIVGYSGHAYMLIDSLQANKIPILGYCEMEEKDKNPFKLRYLGPESQELLRGQNWSIGIGDNSARKAINQKYKGAGSFTSIVHPSAVVAKNSKLASGTFIGPNSIINTLTSIGEGCIINSASIIEHECEIAEYVHIAPSATLAGNVKIGAGTFIGANSTIIQGVSIGEKVIIGAGSVILNDIPSGVKVVGNPGRIL